ncbi:MAG: MgtC/SapB family protein [Candidatus Methylomirabilales bacterium]
MDAWVGQTEVVLAGRIVLAAILSGVVGYEREQADKPAGMRTHILVGMGSALFTVLSIFGFPGLGETSRVAAQIVTGVGFLGAGTIFRGEGWIQGLTTAATIWAVAALGMAVGVGMYALAAVTTVVMLLVLRLPVKRASGRES